MTDRSEPLRVHVSPSLAKRGEELLRKRLGENVSITVGRNAPDPPDFEILVSGRPTPELLDASRELHTLIVPWAGITKGVQALLKGRPQLRVHNLHHNAAATAELAIALLLSVAKNVRRFDAELRENDWSNRGNLQRALQLAGRTAVVIGWGEIGRRVGAVCEAFGMEVLGVSRRGPQDAPETARASALAADEAAHCAVSELATLLPRAQVLIVCCPATDETEGLLGPDELALLPRDCILVNVARGVVIDEEALWNTLSRRRILGAGLDVWYRYPTRTAEEKRTEPSKFPFHELSSVVMSPHRGGHVRETTELRMAALGDALAALAAGEEPAHRVDVEAGY